MKAKFQEISSMLDQIICGGGCPATAYNLYDGKIDRNHLTCYMDYTNSIRKLKSLDNRL